MARLVPSLPNYGNSRTGLKAELKVLKILELGLPSVYTLFHSTGWSLGPKKSDVRGEVDIIAVNQAGDILLMEVKSGSVDFTADGIFKEYDGGPVSVLSQIARTHDAFKKRLKEAGSTSKIASLLVLPDSRIVSEKVQWSKEQIVDVSMIERLCEKVREILPPGEFDHTKQTFMIDFLSADLSIEPDVTALIGSIESSTSRMAEGLTTWIPRIRSDSRVVRVIGTAGSGKTQLALNRLRAEDRLGFSTAYFCFNRPLADHISRIAPSRTCVETFHEFALRLTRERGYSFDFSQSNAFEDLESKLFKIIENYQHSRDFVIIDEMQDLRPEWVEAMLSLLKPDGRALLLEDPEQNMYSDREQFDVDGEIVVRSPENFRSPRIIVDLTNALGLTSEPVISANPYVGRFSEPIIYGERASDVIDKTAIAIQRCIAMNFQANQIALITLKGRERSLILKEDSIGPWNLQRFTGKFNSDGLPVWNSGEIVTDSVFRFKGQAAPAVVLTEVDFPELSENMKRRLFVGLTRARVHWEWVLSERTFSLINSKLVEN